MRNKPNHSTLRLGKSLALAALFCLGGLVPSSPAQDGGRPDQIFLIDRRGEAKNVSGTVQSDAIDELSVNSRGKDRSYDSGTITRVVFGTVPTAYSEGLVYANQDDLENAVRKFRIAAEDSDARGPVRAKARFLAASSLMDSAASSPENTNWSEVVDEFGRFLSDNPSNRLVPTARTKQARAQLLAGEAQLAAELGAAVFGDLDAGGKTAYTSELCLMAGLDSARAFLTAGDPAKARSLFGELEASTTGMLADADEMTTLAITSLKERALLGEGWVLLAEGKTTQANTFFSGQLLGTPSAGTRFSARLGFAETLLLQGKFRDAQLEFAAVSALDYISRDNVAQALSGLIRCAANLPDSDSAERIAAWKESILTSYGDTPAALSVRE
jgi:hypothetical protein